MGLKKETSQAKRKVGAPIHVKKVSLLHFKGNNVVLNGLHGTDHSSRSINGHVVDVEYKKVIQEDSCASKIHGWYDLVFILAIIIRVVKLVLVQPFRVPVHPPP